jgi:hypothetical protein
MADGIAAAQAGVAAYAHFPAAPKTGELNDEGDLVLFFCMLSITLISVL